MNFNFELVADIKLSGPGEAQEIATAQEDLKILAAVLEKKIEQEESEEQIILCCKAISAALESSLLEVCDLNLEYENYLYK